jgi:hypothetical protein
VTKPVKVHSSPTTRTQFEIVRELLRPRSESVPAEFRLWNHMVVNENPSFAQFAGDTRTITPANVRANVRMFFHDCTPFNRLVMRAGDTRNDLAMC